MGELLGPAGLVSAGGICYPMGEVLRTLAPFAGTDLTVVTSSPPRAVVAIGLEQAGRRIGLIANLGDTPQLVSIRGAWREWSLTVGPHEVRRIELNP